MVIIDLINYHLPGNTAGIQISDTYYETGDAARLLRTNLEKKWPVRNNYLCTYDLYSPVHNGYAHIQNIMHRAV
jgi:hypothetical protein